MRFQFNGCCLDTDRRELRRADGLIHVEPQVFDILEFLIKNRDRVVNRDDLIESVWGGRIISESALATRINAARAAIGDTGSSQHVIKTIPRKGFRFVAALSAGQNSAQVDAEERAILSLPDKPSIAVLPFANSSGDTSQDYVTDGIVEGIITGLCRIGWLFVIARNSSFTYKGRAVDVKVVGQELGVRYVLEGSFHKLGNRVRITSQLIDTTTGAHISADRFDGEMGDIFDLQDKVTVAVVGAIAPKLEKAEIARAKRKPTGSLDAYDYYLRGIAAIYQWTKESHDEALRLFFKAIEADPDFAIAHAMAARCYNWRSTNGWTADEQAERAKAISLARRAIDLGKDDANAMCMAGFALARMAGELETGLSLIDEAIALNPNFAHAYLSAGWVSVWLGMHEEALNRYAQAVRLSPIDPHMFNMHAGTATAHLIAGRYEEARAWASRSIRSQPRFGPGLRVAAASFALSGRAGDAQSALRSLLTVDPTLRISNLSDRSPLQADGLATMTQGLRLAGLPE